MRIKPPARSHAPAWECSLGRSSGPTPPESFGSTQDRRRPRHSRAGARERGFSLLEILVAFALLSLSLGVLLRIFGGAGRIAGTADEYSRAIIVAESLLASAGIETPLQPGETNGSVDENYRWRLNVTPYPMPEALPDQQSLGFKPYWVELSVEWGDQDDPRAFDLKTLRLLPDAPGLGGGAVRR